MKQLLHILLLLCGLGAFHACRLVDEDLSDCGTDYQLDYELRLVTNLTTELETELSLAADVNVSAALREHLRGVFTDRAHDVDLSFYDVVEPLSRLHHEHHIMDAAQSSYTLYIPVRRYRHLAVANLEDNACVALKEEDYSNTSVLRQQEADTLQPHRTGLFSARLPMDLLDRKDQEFQVRLYMANAAAAAVLDTTGSAVKDVRVFFRGFATEFALSDSTYRFRGNPVLRAEKVSVAGDSGTDLCFTTVNFPSRDTVESKAEEDETLWTVSVYCTRTDGTVTETVLSVKEPLKAGQLKIIRGQVQKDGSVIPGNMSVGVSVTLDWKAGMEHDVEL